MPRTLSGPAHERTAEIGGFGVSEQFRDLLNRQISAAEVIGRHPAAYVIHHLLVGGPFGAQAAAQGSGPDTHVRGGIVCARKPARALEQ